MREVIIAIIGAIVGSALTGAVLLGYMRAQTASLKRDVNGIGRKNNRAQLIMIALEDDRQKRLWMVGIFRE